MYIGAFDLMRFWETLSMSFVAWYFVAFVIVIVAYYYLVNPMRQWVVILMASILFCLWGGWQVLAVPSLVTVIAYCSGRIIEATERTQKKKRRFFVTLAVVVMITASV